ncbi:hypothetical protein D3C78_1414670 [compost metagenome]
MQAAAAPQDVIAAGLVIDPQDTAREIRVAQLADPLAGALDEEQVTGAVGREGPLAAHHGERAVGIAAQIGRRRPEDVGEIDRDVAAIALGPLPLPQVGGHLDHLLDFSQHGRIEFNLLHHSLYSHCEAGATVAGAGWAGLNEAAKAGEELAGFSRSGKWAVKTPPWAGGVAGEIG